MDSLFFLAAQPLPQSTSSAADDRSTTFRPVQGQTEMQSGEALLVEAYAVIWAIVFVMIFLAWRRQNRIQQRISTLETAIDKARSQKETP